MYQKVVAKYSLEIILNILLCEYIFLNILFFKINFYALYSNKIYNYSKILLYKMLVLIE